MLALITTVFLASLLGSLHCAGMCGAFVAFAVGGVDRNRPGSQFPLQTAYHLGRLVTYSTLGALAGALGSALDLGGSLVGVQQVAGMAAGAMMIIFGVILVLRMRGVKLPHAPIPGVMQKAFARGHKVAMNRPPIIRAAIIGLLTTLLPCGWLYAFVIGAMGTGNAAYGALTMAVFWLGTLPILVAVGAGARTLMGALGRKVPMMTAIALVAVGLFTVFNRLTLPDMSADPAFSVRPASMSESVEQIKSVDSEQLPCCRNDDDTH